MLSLFAIILLLVLSRRCFRRLPGLNCVRGIWRTLLFRTEFFRVNFLNRVSRGGVRRIVQTLVRLLWSAEDFVDLEREILCAGWTSDGVAINSCTYGCRSCSYTFLLIICLEFLQIILLVVEGDNWRPNSRLQEQDLIFFFLLLLLLLMLLLLVMMIVLRGINCSSWSLMLLRGKMDFCYSMLLTRLHRLSL